MMHKGFRRVYKRVRPENFFGTPPLTEEEKAKRKEYAAAVEKQVAADLARQHRGLYCRCIFGILVRFHEATDGWRWRLEIWKAVAYRKSIPPRGPFPQRQAAVKDAAKFIAGVVQSTQGTADLMQALCPKEKP